ncbi:MAG: transposase [Mitsuaria chitosanitabida]|uniref:transposase n=1 Tax=Roseateles chitosanitabidus TaxID=65048 RepID=UPI001B033F90|nr:transposase [Roseateles chitosanitabidus]MBO9687095.1 transposase [Roseateles chitosanitabidus]
MELSFNGLIRVSANPSGIDQVIPGLYRVLLDDKSAQRVAWSLIRAEEESKELVKAKVGRRKLAPERLKRPRKAPREPLVGEIRWVSAAGLQALSEAGLAMPVRLERAAPLSNSESALELYERRRAVMVDFLDISLLQRHIQVDGHVGALISATTKTHGCSRSLVAQCWSLLCRFGVDPRSLRTRLHRCGAPDKPRRVDPPKDGKPGLKKSGRKTTQERINRATGQAPPEDVQPGMSSEWAARVIAADALIPSPKPTWPKRCALILKSSFISEVSLVDGRLELTMPAKGTYPNARQIKRTLTRRLSQLERLLGSTTKRHFDTNMRGLSGRSWEGVPGPNHTWAIDSTVGDIYLRSSINPAWILGRPIVYLIVDVWSTAIVGFHVCLAGPSWDMAKLALFNAAAEQELIARLRNYSTGFMLDPAPTMCFELLADRGEYLSKKHQQTAMRLIPMTSYTPPYRGDLKGIVETLHKIQKDELFMFVPGAMNARRAEMELRKADPSKAVLTLPEYVAVLSELFATYNISANREHRLDAQMVGHGVLPCPAGLWNFGFRAGIGYQRECAFSDLAGDLLPTASASVNKHGVRHFGQDYTSAEIEARQWAAHARNFGGRPLAVNYYPPSMGTIWTPNTGGLGMLELSITQESRSNPAISIEEWADVEALNAMKRTDWEHHRIHQLIKQLTRVDAITQAATQRTKLAIEAEKDGPQNVQPTIAEVRAMELARSQSVQPAATSSAPAAVSEEEMHYADVAAAVLQEVNWEAR